VVRELHQVALLLLVDLDRRVLVEVDGGSSCGMVFVTHEASARAACRTAISNDDDDNSLGPLFDDLEILE